LRKRGNGEGTISRRKDGTFFARYWVETPAGPKRKSIYGRVGESRKELAKRLAKAIADRDKGVVFDDQGLTVRVYLDRWLTDAVRGTVRESTFYRDKCLVDGHLKPSLGRMKLKNLNAMHLQRLYRDKQDSGLSGSTVLKVHQILYKALKQAVKWDLIPRNPADNVKAPAPSSKRMRPLSAPEARRLLEAARGDRLEALYVLAVHTGLRQGELLALAWDAVDLEAGVVSVRKTLTRNGGKVALGDPKTKRSLRTVRLTADAVEALKHHAARQGDEIRAAGDLYDDQGLVFAGEGGNLINPSNLRQRSFSPLLARASLADKGITFHGLRHTCASLLFQRNLHPKLVQDLLGHASVSITLDTYSHMLPGMGGEAADAISDALK
jgi:integrase